MKYNQLDAKTIIMTLLSPIIVHSQFLTEPDKISNLDIIIFVRHQAFLPQW